MWDTEAHMHGSWYERASEGQKSHVAPARLGQQEGGKASASTFLKGLDFNPKDDGKDSECPPRQFRARRVFQPMLSPEGGGACEGSPGSQAAQDAAQGACLCPTQSTDPSVPRL